MFKLFQGQQNKKRFNVYLNTSKSKPFSILLMTGQTCACQLQQSGALWLNALKLRLAGRKLDARPHVKHLTIDCLAKHAGVRLNITSSG